MNHAEVLEGVGRARSLRDLRPLVAELAVVPGKVIFEALFPVAVRAQGEGNGPVAMSAYVLYALNPVCPLPVDEAVASLLPSWDVSIEEVPWYLAKQFGVESVRTSVMRLRHQRTDELSLTRLRTIEYWIASVPTGADRLS